MRILLHWGLFCGQLCMETAMLLGGVGPRGQVLGNLREPWGVLEKIQEYWGLLSQRPLEESSLQLGSLPYHPQKV